MNPTLRQAFDGADARAGAERLAFLRALAETSPEVHAEVVALLAAGDAVDPRFLACADEPEDALPANEPAKTGERVGPFVVVGELGRGGFSVVQRARQEFPVQREVALKRLSLSAGAPAVVARFAAERQTLAGLNHPHIARFFDAGDDALGQPWFAMELVEGLPVTTHVREKHLSRRETVRLFLTVCEAITHAHRQGVIHRDLKPTNLLVDARGHAWVIDFGIAKVLEPLVPATAEITLAGQMIGTPLYMAPERFEGVSDTRADVYALGVILAELLTGGPSRPAALFWQLGPHAWVRHLRENPPAAPNLDRDLDAILYQAMQASPAARYGSVQEFADDLQAWLDQRPVRARPPTFAYHAGRFMRRHRLVFATSAVALAGLLAGLILALNSAARAREGRILAEAERDRANGVTRALGLLIAAANPEASAGRPVPTMAEALDRFSTDLPASIQSNPPVEQDVRLVLGEAWLGQGRLEKAELEFRRVAELEKLTRRNVGEAFQGLAVVAARRNDHAEAARLLASTESRAPEPARPAENDPAATLRRFHHLLLAAHMARHNGDFAAARRQVTEAAQISRRENYEVLETDSAAKLWRALAWLEKDVGDLPAAERAARELVRLAERIETPGGTARPEARGILAEIILDQRPDPAALRLLEEAWRDFAAQYGETHSFTLGFRLSLATHLTAAGRTEEARAHAAAVREAALALPITDPERDRYLHGTQALLESVISTAN